MVPASVSENDILPILARLRQDRLLRSGAYPIHSQEEALRFFDDVGFCRFSHHGDVELPCFSTALAEEVQEEAWGWKDALPNTRRVYYGQIFRFHEKDAIRPGFLSLPMLAARYALSPVFEFGGDASMLPRWTGMSYEALKLAEALERDGALSTSSLRKATALHGKAHASLFHRALVEAQRSFLIVRIGVTSTTRGNYGYVWERFERAYPQIITDSEAMEPVEAAAAIVRQYVDTAAAVSCQRIACVLALTAAQVQAAAEQLVERNILAAIPGSQGLLCTVETFDFVKASLRK